MAIGDSSGRNPSGNPAIADGRGLATSARPERYKQAFQGNEVDARSLPQMMADDLQEIGVTAPPSPASDRASARNST